MENAFAGWIIMIGIVICLFASVLLAVMEYRQEKREKAYAEKEREFQHRRIKDAYDHQIDQLRLAGDDWKKAV